MRKRVNASDLAQVRFQPFRNFLIQPIFLKISRKLENDGFPNLHQTGHNSSRTVSELIDKMQGGATKKRNIASLGEDPQLVVHHDQRASIVSPSYSCTAHTLLFLSLRRAR
jgi:hypothetical protein